MANFSRFCWSKFVEFFFTSAWGGLFVMMSFYIFMESTVCTMGIIFTALLQGVIYYDDCSIAMQYTNREDDLYDGTSHDNIFAKSWSAWTLLLDLKRILE